MPGLNWGAWDSDTASSSNVNIVGDTFELASAIPHNVVDNFEDASADPPGVYESGETVADYYGGDTGAASRQTSTVAEGSTALNISTSSDGERTISSTSGLPRYPSPGDSFAVNVRASISNTFPRFRWATGDETQTPGGYAVMYDTGNTDELSIFRYDGSGNSTRLKTVSVSENVDEWTRMEVDWGTDGSITARLYDSSNTQLGSTNATDSTYSSGGIGFTHHTSRTGGATSYFDGVRIL